MKEHSNAGILKAYADNTDLVIFILDSNSKWIRTNPKALMDYPDDEFFACLPQHNENGQCLHWLNGGNVQDKFEDEWSDIKQHNGNPDWNGLDQIFMNEEFELRIKPRKEKRWIAVNNSLYATPMTFISKQECENYVSVSYQNGPGVTWQSIEIEVEV